MIYFNLENGTTDQVIHDSLDGVPVTLRIVWNERFSHWTMGVFDRQLDPIITGIRLTRGYPLLSGFNLDSVAGDFIFYRINGSKEDADIDSLGNDFDLVYLTEDEMNVIQPS